MKIFIDTLGRDFLLPYLQREMPDAEFSDLADAEQAVLISHTTPTEASSEAERAFIARVGIPRVIIRTAPVVGTGMTGMPRKLAVDVYRGSFMHAPGTDIAISVVHASDVAQAVRLALGSGRTLNATDGTETTLDALADALAWRMKQKRVWKAWSYFGRICRPSAMIRLAAAEAAPTDCRELIDDFGYRPTPVTEYLRTHIYDESSL